MLVQSILQLSQGRPVEVSTEVPIEGHAEARIVILGQPERESIDRLHALNVPIVVVMPSINAATAYLRTAGLSFLDSARQTTVSLAIIDSLLGRGKGLLLTGRGSQLAVHSALRMLSQHLGLTFDKEQILAHVQGHLSRQIPESEDLFEAASSLALSLDDDLAPGTLEGLKTALKGFEPLQVGQSCKELIWSPNLSMNGDALGQMHTGNISMLGPARMLVYGPYLGIPAGKWRASIFFRISDNYAGNKLRVDVSSKEFLGSARGKLTGYGAFKTSIDFSVDEPAWPYEIRLSIEDGAIDGRLEYLGARLERITT